MLFITTSMDDHDAEKRTEQNSILGSGKSKAKITDNIRMRSRNCTTEATDSDRHEVIEADRISATASVRAPKLPLK